MRKRKLIPRDNPRLPDGSYVKLKKDGTPKKAGGKRPGAGRKKGVLHKKLAQTVQSFRERYPVQPLDHFMNILNEVKENGQYKYSMEERNYAAERALPFLNQRLAALQMTGADGGPVQYSLDLKKLSDDELVAFERIMSKAHLPIPVNDNETEEEEEEEGFDPIGRAETG